MESFLEKLLNSIKNITKPLRMRFRALSPQKQRVIIFASIFAVVGALLLWASHAANPFASLEVENGTLSGNASVSTTSDPTASGSRYVQFNAPSTSTGLKISVVGNRLVDANGTPLMIRGVNYSGGEYACIQGWGIFDDEGVGITNVVQGMTTWHTKVVRVPMNEDCWLGINGVNSAYGGANYQKAISDLVTALTNKGMYTILELHWSAPGTTKATGQNPMPDADHAPAFWSSVATTFKNNPAVMFDLFNEPYPDNNSTSTAAWTCWKNGGTCSGMNYQVAGMQTLVNTVRATGATNVIILGGVQYANNLGQWLTYKPTDTLNPTQIVAAAHIYGNNACGAQNNGTCLDSTVAPVAQVVPVIFGEIGDSYDESTCSSANTQIIVSWAESHNVPYLAWTWNTWGSCHALISNFNGTINTTTPSNALYPKYIHDQLIKY